jgi:general secretion pathway protein A
MYERHFQLRERPFALSPDPDYLYPSKVHKEALSYLRYGVEGHAGFVVITGEIGSGKTTLLQSLIGGLDQRTTVARIMNTMLDARELLDAIALDFGIDPSGMSKPVLLHKLADFLVQQRRAGRLSLLIVDEAQNLSLPALEEIRMLSNLETEKSKLIQIILVGQPELRQKLELRQLQQLRQRVTVSYHLLPLDADETARYINHRLKRAAIAAPLEFPRPVTDVIHQRSGGVPRIINVIADATLLFAYGVDRREIDVAITQEALAELDATGVLASYEEEARPSAAAAAPATAAAVATAAEDEARRVVAEVQARELALTARERELARREHELATRQRRLDEDAREAAAVRASHAVAARKAQAQTAPVAASTMTAEATMAPAKSAASPAISGAPLYTYLNSSRAATSPIAAGQRVTPAASSTARSAAGAAAVRQQRFEPELRLAPPETTGFWYRVRRALFGVSEPETGA